MPAMRSSSVVGRSKAAAAECMSALYARNPYRVSQEELGVLEVEAPRISRCTPREMQDKSQVLGGPQLARLHVV